MSITGQSLFVLLTLILFGLTVGLSSLVQLLMFPLIISAVVSLLLGLLVIPYLRRLKASQIIQEDGPQSHLKKAGTPTMGGIFFVPVALLVSLAFSHFNSDVLAVCLVSLGYMAIGWYDDWVILRKRSNKGISARTKLFLQILVATLFIVYLYLSKSSSLEQITNVNLPGKIILPLGVLFWPLAGFAMTAESNATNLTDGVDGLAGGTGAIAFIGLGLIILPSQPNLAIFCACFAGACLGFIWHNRHPAKVFMGDTGSLALGGALAAVAILSGQLWGLLIISGIFFAESISVIAQVGFYKLTKGPDGKGKRLLKMAPLHHHLELSGWQETQVVGMFYLVNTLLVLLAIFTAIK
ncbi:MAG: phospho-N-acetylmuramoyl-pentapeptide-transferase [Cyanobacteriota bacterium ELA615]